MLKFVFNTSNDQFLQHTASLGRNDTHERSHSRADALCGWDLTTPEVLRWVGSMGMGALWEWGPNGNGGPEKKTSTQLRSTCGFNMILANTYDGIMMYNEDWWYAIYGIYRDQWWDPHYHNLPMLVSYYWEQYGNGGPTIACPHTCHSDSGRVKMRI